MILWKCVTIQDLCFSFSLIYFYHSFDATGEWVCVCLWESVCYYEHATFWCRFRSLHWGSSFFLTGGDNNSLLFESYMRWCTCCLHVYSIDTGYVHMYRVLQWAHADKYQPIFNGCEFKWVSGLWLWHIYTVHENNLSFTQYVFHLKVKICAASKKLHEWHSHESTLTTKPYEKAWVFFWWLSKGTCQLLFSFRHWPPSWVPDKIDTILWTVCALTRKRWAELAHR